VVQHPVGDVRAIPSPAIPDLDERKVALELWGAEVERLVRPKLRWPQRCGVLTIGLAMSVPHCRP
jgi:hypothetical protein